MILKVNKEKHILHTVKLWSGYHDLTKLEVKLMCSIIKHYLDLNDTISNPVLAQQNFLSSEFKKVLREEFSIKQPQLSTYFTSLKRKKVLKEVDGTYMLDSKFIPASKIVIEYRYE